ncbi:quinolinate synthase [Candidatus Peregrinibacteria bacterium]|nr:quinolinate synthase [Candidatus Peregrinibacteria bacterium]
MLPNKYKAVTHEASINKILDAKKKLGKKVFILAHHYQRDEIVEIADAVGDSLKLSKIAAATKSKYIIFCGVHFMAETADIINKGKKVVILPDINAGCPMADMAEIEQVEKTWMQIDNKDFIPVTYINSKAQVKAFCGKNNGYICTSSNADKILHHLFKNNKKVFFLPDKNLGINTANKLGLSKSEIKKKLFLWDGYCPVHMLFKTEQVEKIKQADPEVNILVHPEVPPQVAAKADFMGSTEYIIDTVQKAKKGTKWAIATEVHLVARIARKNPDKHIQLLSSPVCMCSMMDRTSPQHVAYVMESLLQNKIINRIKVEKNTARLANLAIKRMLQIS